MIRRIIRIDEEKCNGCGACAEACHEGAIRMVDGKAKLTREDYCDGLGDCLPACPAGAISFEEREAPAYDEQAVRTAKKAAGGCPGSRPRVMDGGGERDTVPAAADRPVSRLAQWPCQIKLVPAKAPFFDGARLLVAADCTAYACASVHEDYMKGKVTLIGCPKLDGVDYSEKLGAILAQNDVSSITVLRMEVPCCGGLEYAVKKGMEKSGKLLPWRVVTLSVDGKVLDES